MSMLPTHILELIGKKLSGDATPEELHALAQWETEYPEAGHLQALLQALEPKEPTFVQVESGSQLLEKGWTAVSQQLETPVIAMPHRRHWLKWAVAAVSIGIIVSAVYLGMQRTPDAALAVKNPHTEVSTRHGSRSKIELPDGTKVWLNAGSRLTYADDFSNSHREVNLNGEAYFDVVTDPAHPLVVHTPAMSITVLGTRFDVRAYKEDVYAEATLVNGKISVALPGSKPVVLEPLQQFRVDQLGRTQTTVADVASVAKPTAVPQPHIPDSVLTATAWVRNELQFKKEPFDDVMRRLERWYNVSIVVQQPGLHSELVSGSFTTETVTQALKALQYTTNFRYSMRGDTIVIQ